MFWKKKKAKLAKQRQEVPVPAKVAPKTKQEELEDAAKKLGASLRSYADASYAAHQPPPDDELRAAHRKVEIARKVVSEGRIAYALGRCLPEHMAHWHAWSQRDDFMKWVGFDASNITSSRTQEEIGVRRIEVTTNHFTFKDHPYCLVFRDGGLSSAPGDPYYTGEVHFFAGELCVAKFDVTKDLMKDYSEWQFSDVKGFKVGDWMQDVLDMAAQIETHRQRSVNQFVDDRARKAADEIDLG
ncbi:hypothetical protein ELI00_37535 [Rhizobium ruizarguesonis]|uniref:hypothetical protein n=1 Tax=Rhizobium ruizarguesonis TaxID=2081791 RepID=UPI0010323B01|nr:hypothetical protein [Rhizobium ruizarguesonis]TAX63347.1 hypothetical protein ELI00_37535 [Rhizobium ruizarguesonis]